MRQRTLGDRTVSAIGLGGMPMSIEGRPDAERSIATVHAALDVGVTLIDTADSYHRDANEVGHNEELIARALREYGTGAADVLVATKGGHLRPGDGTWTRNGDPAYPKRAAKESARRLGVDAIGLYQFHRPDPAVPYADSIGAIRELLDEGVILMAGISNADVAQIDEGPAKCSAADLCRCRTSSRPRSAPAGENSSTARSSASRSCRGARSVASRTPRTLRRVTVCSNGSPTRSAPVSTRWRSRGSSHSRPW